MPNHVRLFEVLGGASPTPQDALGYVFGRDLYVAAHTLGAESVKRHLHFLPELADENARARGEPYLPFSRCNVER